MASHACLNCGAHEAELKCGRCKTSYYCGPSCQRKHWLVHRAGCASGKLETAPQKPVYDDFAVAATELGVRKSKSQCQCYFCVDTLHRLLQHGNFSIVYKATHKGTQQAYALKVLDKAKIRRMAARHPSINLEVMQEKHLGLLLSPHPGIAHLHLTFQDEGRLFYLYDLIPGGELWKFLTAPLTPLLPEPRVPAPASGRVAAALTRRIVELLAYLHRKGVAHRDLKPENVLVALQPLPVAANATTTSPARDDGEAAEALWSRLAQLTLIDFATAKDLVEPTHNSRSEFTGTPDYMAPEAIDNRGAGRGEPTDTRADLWSVGCMLYQTMAGLPPFRSAGAYATFQKVLRHAALSARAMTRSIAAGGSESRTDPLGRLCLDDGSIDIDGLLYPAIFAPPARALVDALLCDAATRLGCDGAAGAVVAGCDRELTQSARPEMPMSATPVPVSAPPVDGAAGASTKLSPHAEVSDSTSVLKPRIPASLHKARRALKATPTSFPESTPASIPERGTSRALPPASATVPLLLPFVDHGALLRHAFLASECRARDADTDLSGWSSVTEECTLLEIGTAALRGAATGDEPLLLCALNLLSMRVASLKPVPLACLLIPKCSSLSSPTASPDSPISEWHAAAAVVRSLDWSSTLELMHMVALRRRIHVPHISALFSPGDPALARCVRWVGLPNRRSTGIAQELFRCGELGPREAQGWNLSLSAYCFPADEPLRRAWVPAMLRDRAIEPGEAVNDMGWRVVSAQDYHSLNYLVVVPNASALLDGAAAGTCDALDPLVAAINALSPAPRAILFTGRLFPAAGTDDLDDARRADRLRSMLSRFSATLRNESTSVILATEDRVWASAALLGSGADASRDDSAFRLRLETACGAWLSGLRLLICDADVAVLAAEMQADVASSTSGSGLSSVRLPSTAHEADALWLLDTLEHARSGSHHTVLVLRDSAVAPGCRTASTANPSDSALAHLLSESNVRCVVDTQPAAATDSALPVSHAVSCLNRVSVHAIRVLGQGHQHFGESADAAVAPASAGDLASDPTGTAGGGANDESENSLSIRRATFPSTQPMSRLIQACQAHTMLSESMTVLPVPADTAGARAGDSDGVVSTDSEFAVPLPVAASGLKPKTCSDPFRLALHLLKVSRFDVDPCTIILPMRQVPVLQPRSTASTSTASPAAASTQSTGEGESSGDQRWVTDEVEVFSAAEIAAELSAMEGGTGTAGHASRSAAADS